MEQKSLIKEQILDSYRNILLTKRRQEQVDKIINSKSTIAYLDRCAENIIKWEIGNVSDFIQAQFFALNYMPYLPSMMHISSDKSLERYNKVKSYFKFISQKKNLEKIRKSQLKKVIFDKDIVLSLVELIRFEEDDKKRFHNKLKGFLLCIESTSLFHPKSKVCLSCNYKNACKTLLKKRCLPLFRVRHKLISEETFLKQMKKKDYHIV